MHQCQTCTGYLTLDAISYRCGRVWTLSRPAEWCWARPTQPTPNPAPSGETTASKLESKEQILSAVQSWTSTFLYLGLVVVWPQYCNGCMLYQYLAIQFYCLCGDQSVLRSLWGLNYSLRPFRNIIHGSDSVESAKHEISLWFKDDEVSSYVSCAQSWLYD